MKTLKIVCIYFLCIFLVACGKKNNDKTKDLLPSTDKQESEEISKDSNEEIFISGTVISAEYSQNEFKDFILLTEDQIVYRVIPIETSSNAAEPGQEVLVTVKGTIAEGNPMQAVAETIDVTKEFNKSPLLAEIYPIYGIIASNLSKALPSSGYRFYRLSNYTECMNFLEQNDLRNEFENIFGSSNLSNVTESFFENNDIGLFIINGVVNGKNEPSGIFYSDTNIYLKIERTSSTTVLTNTRFDIFLIPLTKGIEISNGMVLINHYLNPSTEKNE